MGLTFFTSIEVSLIAPAVLFCLGYDSAAALSSSVLLLLGIISQIPKKFIFRPRPWMVGRALPIRHDTTSSFPSRAVVCAVTFSWLVASSLQIEGLVSTSLSPFLLWPIIMAMAALTAFARINVGAHYPSDTILGFLLGCFVVNMGARLDAWSSPLCLSSYPSPPLILTSWTSVLRHSSYRTLFPITLLSYTITLISIQGFWLKCSYVYGLLLSSIAFRFTYICASPSSTSTAVVAQIVHHPSFPRHVQATATIAALLVFGMLTRGKKGLFRILTFTIIYFGALFAMISWRLRPEHTIQ